MSKVKVKAHPATKTLPDGGFPVVLWDKDEQHQDGEIFIADDKTHSVERTAGVSLALSNGTIVEVGSEEAKEAEAQVATESGETTKKK